MDPVRGPGSRVLGHRWERTVTPHPAMTPGRITAREVKALSRCAMSPVIEALMTVIDPLEVKNLYTLLSVFSA